MDDFYDIGMGFTSNEINEHTKLPNHDMVSFGDNYEEETELTSDGRDKNKFSIVYKPDPNIPVPDTTGNGVATEELEIDKNTYTGNINAINAKKIFNVTVNIFQYIRTACDNILALCEFDELSVKTLYENQFKTNPLTKIVYSYYQNIDSSIGINLLKFINDFDPNKINMFDSYIKTINTFDVEIFNLDYCKRNKSGMGFKDVFSNWETFKLKIKEIRALYDYMIKIDCNKLFNNKTILLKKNMKNYNQEESIKVLTIVEFIYKHLINYSKFFDQLLEDLKIFITYFKPRTTQIIIDKSKIIFGVDNKLDPWVSADYHLLKELLKGHDTSLERSKELIKWHNSVVKPNDLFLFLGDLSESEFFDNPHTDPEILKTIISYSNLLHGKKIMFIGNNDTAPLDFYRKCGFSEIYVDPIITKKYIFSHGPIKVINNALNVHGHIHGSKKYWEVDWHNHVDAYYGLWGKPVKLSYLTSKKILDMYYNGCITQHVTFVDEETIKQPSNIKL
jgi:calcineurin-like phosphoesterase family protein